MADRNGRIKATTVRPEEMGSDRDVLRTCSYLERSAGKNQSETNGLALSLRAAGAGSIKSHQR